MAEDQSRVEAANFSDASQPVNLFCVNHRLTRTWFVPLSSVYTWFVPLPVCAHSQGVYFLPNRGQSIVSRILFEQINKQNKQKIEGDGFRGAEEGGNEERRTSY